jgi:hypothetical protein
MGLKKSLVEASRIHNSISDLGWKLGFMRNKGNERRTAG